MLFFQKKEKPSLDILSTTFDAQKSTLLKKGYPNILHISPEAFETQMQLLWKAIAVKASILEFAPKGNIPLLIIVKGGDALEKIKIYQRMKNVALTPAIGGKLSQRFRVQAVSM